MRADGTAHLPACLAALLAVTWFDGRLALCPKSWTGERPTSSGPGKPALVVAVCPSYVRAALDAGLARNPQYVAQTQPGGGGV